MSKEEEKELLKEYDSYEGFGAAVFILAIICLAFVAVVSGIIIAIIN